MPTVSTSRGEIFYIGGGTNGPALLCIHGAGGTHALWEHQLHDLSDIAQVYALDLPGHGRSSPPGQSSIAGYGAALINFMDERGITRAVLAGSSMGGAIALWAALHAPERVAGLGLIGTGARLRVAPAILEGFAHDLPATIRLIVDFSFAPAAATHLLDQAEASYTACDPVVYHGDFLACHAFDVLAQLPEVICPTVVICGAEDRMTPPKYSETLRDRIPGAALTIVPDAGHMVMIERPTPVNAALRTLLTVDSRQ